MTKYIYNVYIKVKKWIKKKLWTKLEYTLSCFKIYNKAIVIHAMCYWYKCIHRAQWSKEHNRLT